MSADAVARLTSKYAALAATACPTLATKKITPHTMRHTAAMNLLHAGVDITVIALWLGHESPETTRIYLHADMKLKEDAISPEPPRPEPKPPATRLPTPCSPSSTSFNPRAPSRTGYAAAPANRAPRRSQSKHGRGITTESGD